MAEPPHVYFTALATATTVAVKPVAPAAGPALAVITPTVKAGEASGTLARPCWKATTFFTPVE